MCKMYNNSVSKQSRTITAGYVAQPRTIEVMSIAIIHSILIGTICMEQPRGLFQSACNSCGVFLCSSSFHASPLYHAIDEVFFFLNSLFNLWLSRLSAMLHLLQIEQFYTGIHYILKYTFIFIQASSHTVVRYS